MQRRKVIFLGVPGDDINDRRFAKLLPSFSEWEWHYQAKPDKSCDILWTFDPSLAKRIANVRYGLLVFDDLPEFHAGRKGYSIIREAGKMIIERCAHVVIKGTKFHLRREGETELEKDIIRELVEEVLEALRKVVAKQ